MDPTRARAILQSLADGLDPATGAPFPPGSPCQHPDTVRALHAAQEALSATAVSPADTTTTPAAKPPTLLRVPATPNRTTTVRSEPRSMFVTISHGAGSSARRAEGTRDNGALHHGDRATGRMKTRISPPENFGRVGRRTPVTSANPRNAHITGEYHHAPCVRMCVQSPPRFDLFRLVTRKPGNQSHKAKTPAFTKKGEGFV